MTAWRWVLVIVVCFVLVRAATAQELDPRYLKQAEQAIESAIADRQIPGAVLLIGNADGVLYRQAFGDQRLQPHRVPMSADTIFDLASLTKSLATAPSIMKLVEDGKIALDDPVAKYIPAFGANGKEQVTIAQLLLHRGGLEPDNSMEYYRDGRDAAMAAIYRGKLMYEPGTRFEYSDLGYIVLGELVHVVSGMTLDDFATKNFYEPLGMTHARFNPPAEWSEHLAPTAKVGDTWLTGRVHDPRAAALGGVAGHAGLFASIDDLTRFCWMMLRGGELDGHRVLSQKTVEAMIQSRSLPDWSSARAYGFDIDSDYSSARGLRFPRGVSFGHTGFTGTMFWIDPLHRCFVILLTNRLHAGSRSVLDLYRSVSTASAMALLGPVQVYTGIDVLEHGKFAALDGRRVALITNQTGRDRFGKSTIDLLHDAKNVQLVALLSPEHGLVGKVDEKVADATDAKTGLPVYSLYGDTRRPTDAMLKGVDTIVFDIQDVGTRFYTYITTLGYAMEEAGKRHIRFVVLDRPNPIGPVGVSGPIADADKLSFTAYQPLPITHGMTVGELARMFKYEQNLDVDLAIVPMVEYDRAMWYDQTGLPWINPSPNLRNPTQAVLYPAIGLLEFTNLSVGRGTDEPFERLGAPWIDGRKLALILNELKLPGVRFVPITFTPESSKFANEVCGGVHIELIDRTAFRPARTGLSIAWTLRQLFGDQFDAANVQKLLVNDEVQATWPAIDDPAKVSWNLDDFMKRRARYLIYR